MRQISYFFFTFVLFIFLFLCFILIRKKNYYIFTRAHIYINYFYIYNKFTLAHKLTTWKYFLITKLTKTKKKFYIYISKEKSFFPGIFFIFISFFLQKKKKLCNKTHRFHHNRTEQNRNKNTVLMLIKFFLESWWYCFFFLDLRKARKKFQENEIKPNQGKIYFSQIHKKKFINTIFDVFHSFSS